METRPFVFMALAPVVFGCSMLRSTVPTSTRCIICISLVRVGKDFVSCNDQTVALHLDSTR